MLSRTSRIPAGLVALLTGGSVLLAACGAPATATPAPASPNLTAVPVRVEPATRGEIAQNNTYTGDIKPKYQVQLNSKATGRVVEVLVDLGAVVHAGDVIARLDVDQQQVQVAQAEANRAAAVARLDQLRAGPRAEQVGVARANWEAARQKLDLLQAGSRAEDIETAQAQLDAARAKLAALEGQGRPEDTALVQAQLDAARTRLVQLKEGGRVEQVQTARAALDTARANADRMKTAASGAKENARLKAEQAANAIRQAQQAYSKAYWDWDIVQRTGKRPDLADKPGVPAPGLTDYEKRQYQEVLETARRAMDDAEKALQAAQLAYEQAKKDEIEQIRAADAMVEQARQQLALAQQPASQRDLEQQEAVVRQFEAMLARAAQPYTEQDIEQARAAVRQAAQMLQKAREPVRPQETAQARAAVDAATQQLALAQQPFTAEDLEAADAQVEIAQAAVDLAQLGLKEGEIIAPVSGVVAERLVNVGSLISPQIPLLTLVSEQVEVTVPVQEAAIGGVKIGQATSLRVAAFPSRSFAGTVTSVAPTVDARTRTFAVKVVPTDTTGDLKAGMFAEVEMDALAKQDALLVPRAAVEERAGLTFVYVVRDGVAREQKVKLGLQNEAMVEILTGLQAGDQVVTDSRSGLKDGDPVRVA